VIGLRFLLRGVLAVGGAVSTDPNAAHGDGPAHEDAEGVPAPDAPAPDAPAPDAPAAPPAKPEATAEPEKGEPAKPEATAAPEPEAKPKAGPDLEATKVDTKLAEEAPTAIADPPKRASSIPPPGDVPTAQRLEAAQQAAALEEEERTLVGDLSELARAQELREEQERKKADKKGGDK
jgi:hypothetical protein